MYPAHSFNEVGNYLGLQNIESVEVPQIANQYCLKGEGASQIQKSISKELLQFLTIEKDWNVAGLNYFMIFYKQHKIVPTTELVSFYEKGKQLVDMFTDL